MCVCVGESSVMSLVSLLAANSVLLFLLFFFFLLP